MKTRIILPVILTSAFFIGSVGPSVFAASLPSNGSTSQTTIQPLTSTTVGGLTWSPTYPSPRGSMYLTGIVNYNISWYDYGSLAYLTYGQAGGAGAFKYQSLVKESGPIHVGESYWMTPGGWNGQALTGSTCTVVFSSPSEQVTGLLGVKTSPADPANVGVGTYAGQEYTAWKTDSVYFQ